MTTAAQQKRYDGIGSIADEFLTPEPPFITTTDTEEIAEFIRALIPLGRTDRWRAQVERWARMVEDSGEDSEPPGTVYPNRLHWAIVQGMVYANFAAS